MSISCQRYGASRITRLASVGDASCSLRYSRLRLALLCSSRCERNALRRITFPVAVTRKRFLVPLCVLIFGIAVGPLEVAFSDDLRCDLHLPRRPLVIALLPATVLLVERAENHDHVAPFHQRHPLDDGQLLELIRHPVQELASMFLVDQLATVEH